MKTLWRGRQNKYLQQLQGDIGKSYKYMGWVWDLKTGF